MKGASGITHARAIVLALAVTSLLVLATGCAMPGAEPRGGAPTARLAVQQAIASRLGMPVMLDVQMARAYEDWMFLAGRPLTEGGRPIDYTRTPFAQDVAEGVFDDNFSALVRRDAQGGRGWQVVELSLGATDAPFIGWFERYSLPLDLASRTENSE